MSSINATKSKWRNKIEERLARLEEHKHDNADGAINMKYPSKPIEPMATYSEHGVEIGKPEKTVTDALSIGHLSDIGAFKQKGAKLKLVTEEKPTEFGVTSIDAVVWAKEFMRCYKKFGYEVDEDTMRGWFASSIMAGFDEANRRNKNNYKPSEFITPHKCVSD